MTHARTVALPVWYLGMTSCSLQLCRIAAFAVALLLSACWGGCASKAGRRLETSDRARAAVQSVIGRSVEGRDIECMTIGRGAMTVLLIATIHGDEPAGTPLLQRLEREAAANPRWMHDRTIVLVPLANPDGFAARRRGNMRGVDLNRNFPADSFTSRRRHGAEPLSEPESRALHDLIIGQQPQRIISLHQPLACIDYDGDAAALAHAMADACAAPHRLPVRKLGAYPGSLGSFAGEDLGIPIITVEFPASASGLNHEELWTRYGPMLLAAITHP
jgi:protein MpaA